MKKKGMISLFLSMIILFSMTSNALATSKNNILHDDGNIQITLMQKSDDYTKIKIENKIENKIEFLESYLQEDGTYKSIATVDKKEYIIYTENNVVIVEDDDNNIIETISLDSNQPSSLKNGKVSTRIKSTCIPNSSWKSASNQRGYTSKSIRNGDLSMVIGVIAGIVATPPVGIAVTIGTWLYSRNAKDAYYYYEVQDRIYDGMSQRRTYIQFYTDSSYKERLNSGQYSDIRNMYRIGVGC